MRLLFLAATILVLAVASINPQPFGFSQLSNLSKGKKTTLGKIFQFVKGMIWKSPTFCNGLECPKYKEKKKTANYELRCYPSYKWTGTVTEGTTKRNREAFMRLFKYIQGENKEKKKIAMTVPVATKVELGKGKGGTNRYTMLFFVPYEYQKSPPEPTNPLVTTVTLPPVCVYVRSYGGYSTERKEKLNVNILKKSLAKDKVKDYTDPTEVYFTGGYDSPWKFWDRHNEIWFLEKSDNRIN